MDVDVAIFSRFVVMGTTRSDSAAGIDIVKQPINTRSHFWMRFNAVYALVRDQLQNSMQPIRVFLYNIIFYLLVGHSTKFRANK